jgi:hypothetical protein
MRITQLIIVAAPAAVSSFITSPRSGVSKSPMSFNILNKQARTLCFSASSESSKRDDENEHIDNDLVLDGLDQEMGNMASKFSFSELDFLAAAKKRAEARVISKNASAGDDDWKTLAEERKTNYGEIDDWENSMKEAGNQDSQILMFTDPSANGEDDGEDAERTLLLF